MAAALIAKDARRNITTARSDLSNMEMLPVRRGGGRKKIAGVPRMIPGDRGKVESGWLAQPLEDRFARGGNRRQYSPVPLAAFARCQ
jgi:hypothetical protein